jgi:hypothetical protein
VLAFLRFFFQRRRGRTAAARLPLAMYFIGPLLAVGIGLFVLDRPVAAVLVPSLYFLNICTLVLTFDYLDRSPVRERPHAFRLSLALAAHLPFHVAAFWIVIRGV